MDECDAPFGPSPALSPERPGAVRVLSSDIELAAGAQRRAARLRNTGPRDVWISSHFPLSQVNPAVEVAAADAPSHRGDRASLRGDWHLDLPAGEALLLRAGEGRGTVLQLMHEAHPTGEDVVERHRQLVSSGPRHLDLEVVMIRGKGPELVGRHPEGSDLRGGRAMAIDE